MNPKPKIPVIAGPTASGKTAAGIALCQALNGEIISADSRQIYRYMNIGTAKPTIEEQNKVKHHLLDILYPNEVFSAGEFVKQAIKCIQKIAKTGKLPVVVGGATLYIRALTGGIFDQHSKNPALRRKLMKKYEQDAESMMNELLKLDPKYAIKVHRNDRKKLVRFFEIYHTTGHTISELHQIQPSGWIEPIMMGIHYTREELYHRINQRVEKMLEMGLIDEVKKLRQRGYNRELYAFNSPGYIEVFRYLDGEIDYEAMIESIKRNTRRYAKRQITWFKKDDVKWFKPGEIERMIEYIKTKLCT